MGLVLISHSGDVVEGLRDMVAQVAGEDVAVGIAGGTEDGRLGHERPADRGGAALRPRRGRGRGASCCSTSGSAALSLELALEELEPADRERVRVSEAPLVEGAILAAVQASIGAVARRGGGRRGRRRDDAQAARGTDRCPKLTLVVADPAGLHARPAARFVQAASKLREPHRHPPRRPRGGRQEPHRPARPDDPPVVRDHPVGRRPRCRRGPRPRLSAELVALRQPRPADRTEEVLACRPRPLAQKLTAEAIGTAILVFIGAGSVPLTVFLTGDEPVRQRRAVDDLVRVRVRDLRRRLLGRPHQRLPHQPGRHDRPAGDPQDRRRDGRRLHRRPARRRDRRRGPHLHHPDRQRPGQRSASARSASTPTRPASPIGFAAEVIGTAILVFTVFGAAVDGQRPGGFAGIVIGFIVYGDHHPRRPDHRRRAEPGSPDRPGHRREADRRPRRSGSQLARLHRRPDRRWPDRRLPYEFIGHHETATVPVPPSPSPATAKPSKPDRPSTDPEGGSRWRPTLRPA